MTVVTPADLKQGRDFYLIGLTGNIACGKSTVLKMLVELGADVIDADTAVHKIMQPGESAYQPIIERFGAGILATTQPDAPIDRRKLGAIVFADPQALRDLEQISHPRVRVELLRQLAATTAPVVVLDAIKLIENGLADGCDSIWVVTCPPAAQLARLMQRNNFTEAEALARIQAQPDPALKIVRANVVIDNGGDLSHTRAQVETALQQVKSEK